MIEWSCCCEREEVKVVCVLRNDSLAKFRALPTTEPSRVERNGSLGLACSSCAECGEAITTR